MINQTCIWTIMDLMLLPIEPLTLEPLMERKLVLLRVVAPKHPEPVRRSFCDICWTSAETWTDCPPAFEKHRLFHKASLSGEFAAFGWLFGYLTSSTRTKELWYEIEISCAMPVCRQFANRIFNGSHLLCGRNPGTRDPIGFPASL